MNEDEDGLPEREVVAAADPYGMFETRKRVVQIKVERKLEDDGVTFRVRLCAALERVIALEDGEAQSVDPLDVVEQDIREFWISQQLPAAIGRYWRLPGGPWLAEPPSRDDAVNALARHGPNSKAEACRHPAERAEPRTWLARSWELWRLCERARRHHANNDINGFGSTMFALGLKFNQVSAARQHGPDVKGGRQLTAMRRAGGQTPKSP
jgi:hypothetical protein